MQQRLVAGPWVRDLKTGAARRHDRSGRVLAEVRAVRGGWSWAEGLAALERENAKAAASAALRGRGLLVLDAPPGCEIEKG